ncbi:MAG: hypothetical protein KY476_19935 [Planctomycetes bacterium]|nr:hypothetical protein [Planctomycetota bacterium]
MAGDECIAAADTQAGDLSAESREALFELLVRGVPLAMACQKLGLSLESIAAAATVDPLFRGKLQLVQEMLSRNVAAALYKSSLEGKVPAQVAYLKAVPPPEWLAAAGSTAGPATWDDTLGDLNDDEFQELARAMGADLSLENEGGVDPPQESHVA